MAWKKDGLGLKPSNLFYQTVFSTRFFAPQRSSVLAGPLLSFVYTSPRHPATLVLVHYQSTIIKGNSQQRLSNLPEIITVSNH